MLTHKMKDYKPILVNGEELKEGEILNRWFSYRFNANKNVLIGVIGPTGSGKSFCCIRVLEDWYKYRFNKQFPSEHICFSIKEAVKLINSGRLHAGDFIIVEEAGVLMNALDFQNKIVKFFGFVLQSFRSKNIGIIFNTPNFSFMGKTQRSLLHGLFETVRIDAVREEVIIKAKYLQVNSYSGKCYPKYFRQRIGNRMVKIERLAIGKPSDDIIKVYEERKAKFVDKIGMDLEEAIDLKESGREITPITEPQLEIVKKLKDEGYNMNEITKKLSFDHKTLRRIYDELNKRQYMPQIAQIA